MRNLWILREDFGWTFSGVVMPLLVNGDGVPGFLKWGILSVLNGLQWLNFRTSIWTDLKANLQSKWGKNGLEFGVDSELFCWNLGYGGTN